MGITNPRAEGAPYNSFSIFKMFKNRLWDTGKSYNAMKDIFLEPIVENLIRRNVLGKTIEEMVGRARGWTGRYVKRRWGFCTIQDARNFLATNYLGFHEADYYLD